MRHSEKKFKVKHHRLPGSFKVPIISLYLPRPGLIPEHLKQYFPKGGVYPLHFERKLKKYIGTSNYLHMFAGAASTGFRIDVRQELKPDLVCDVHHLPFKDNCFEGVVADPPYHDRFSQKYYQTGKLKERTWLNEAIRVCKPGGKIGIYHNFVMQPTKQIRFALLVLTILRFRQYVRVLSVFTKLGKTTKITDFIPKSTL